MTQIPQNPVTSNDTNPFYIGLNGLKLLFNNAKSVAIFGVIISAIGFVLNAISSVIDAINQINSSRTGQRTQEFSNTQMFSDMAQNTGAIVIFAVLFASLLFIVIALTIFIYGVFDYTSARLAKDENVTLKQAAKAVSKDFVGLLWVYIILTVKVFLWPLLFIIPGIIMAVRYILAGTVFFAEGKRGNAAVQRSSELTKGAWLTTFAGYGLWNIITFGMTELIIRGGALAILYTQLQPVTDSGEAKPKAHWLSIATLVSLIALISLAFLLLLLLATVLVSTGFS